MMRTRTSNSNDLQEVLEDYIEELKESEGEDDAATENQKTLITNVIKTRDLTVSDVMVPRADIMAIDENIGTFDLKDFFAKHQHSRIPVYRGSLDHVVGILHIKDILTHLLAGESFKITDLTREALIVTPGLPLMELFVMLREDKRHMALVLDEHGGIDGLITMIDVIEAIVGDIEDEFDNDEQPQLIEKPDGSIISDGRMDIEEFEERYGNILDADEREDIDTLGGLASSIAGRVPMKGETLKHSSGMILEIIESDHRRVKRLRLRNLPHRPANDEV